MFNNYHLWIFWKRKLKIGGKNIMTKEELITLLKDYNENNSKLRLRKKEIKNLENKLNKTELDINISTSFGINEDIRSKNQITDKVGNTIIKVEAEREKIKCRIKDIEEEIISLQEKVEEAEIRLNALHYKEREMMIAYYCENRTTEDISQNLYFKLFNRTCSPRYIRKLIKINTERLLKL